MTLSARADCQKVALAAAATNKRGQQAEQRVLAPCRQAIGWPYLPWASDRLGDHDAGRRRACQLG